MLKFDKYTGISEFYERSIFIKFNKISDLENSVSREISSVCLIGALKQNFHTQRNCVFVGNFGEEEYQCCMKVRDFLGGFKFSSNTVEAVELLPSFSLSLERVEPNKSD